MLENEYTPTIPPGATCKSCRHCAYNPLAGLTWCEVLARYVDGSKWCEDWQGTRPEDYAAKSVEKY